MLNGIPSTIAEKVVAVPSLSCVQLFATPWTAALQAPFPVLHHLPEFAETHIY